MATRETERLGSQIKRYRITLGLTQEELAERAGVSVRSISDLERGLERVPQLGTIRRLADALELSAEQRTGFIAAGTQTRGAESVAVPEARAPWKPALPRRAFISAVLVVAAVAIAFALVINHARDSHAGRPTVYSTPRAPVLLGAWGNGPARAVRFGPGIAQLALAPNGDNYAIGYGSRLTALRFSPNGQELGLWPVSPRNGPTSGATDARGDLWVPDGQDVWAFSPVGQTLAHWHRVGFNPGQFETPIGIAIAPNGDVVVGEYNSHRVQVLTPAGRPLHKWEGPGKSKQHFAPNCIVVDKQSNVYIFDLGTWAVDKYTLSGKLLAVWHPRGIGSTNGKPGGFDISLDRDGHIYVMESTAKWLHIAKLSSAGRELALWTPLGPHPEVTGYVTSLRFSAGNFGYASVAQGRVLKINMKGHILASWSSKQLSRPLFRSPAAIAADQEGHVYVADALTRHLTSLSPLSDGGVRWSIPVSLGPASLFTTEIAIVPHGRIVVVNAARGTVATYSSGGKLIRSSSEPYAFKSSHIGIDGRGDVSVLDFQGYTLRTFTSSGRIIHTWCADCNVPNAGAATAMTVDGAGNVYLAFATEIVEISPAGIPIRSWNGAMPSGRDRFTDATSLALDRSGNLYVTEADRHALEVFSPTDHLLARWTRAGPNGPRFTYPAAVAVDPTGNIYLADGPQVIELAPLKPRRPRS